MFSKDLIKPGDILLFRVILSSSWSSKFIGWAQRLFGGVPKGFGYCHVALVDQDTDLMLEARWPKTRVSKIDLNKLNKEYGIELYRVRKITDEQIEQVIMWLHNHLDEWYDIPLFLTGFLDSKHSEICSTFISHAFQDAGLEIPVNNWHKKLVVPNDFYEDTITLDRIA
jgi:hypothetical protein